MASEIVEQPLKAFAGLDQSIFMSWLEGLADLIHTGGNPTLMDPRTMKIVGGMMFTIVQAANEVGQREWQEAH